MQNHSTHLSVFYVANPQTTATCAMIADRVVRQTAPILQAVTTTDVVRLQVIIAMFSYSTFPSNIVAMKVFFVQNVVYSRRTARSKSYCYVVQNVASGDMHWTAQSKRATLQLTRATSTFMNFCTTTRTASESNWTTPYEGTRASSTTRPWTCSSTVPLPTVNFSRRLHVFVRHRTSCQTQPAST